MTDMREVAHTFALQVGPSLWLLLLLTYLDRK
jgi:hypothetical protein